MDEVYVFYNEGQARFFKYLVLLYLKSVVGARLKFYLCQKI